MPRDLRVLEFIDHAFWDHAFWDHAFWDHAFWDHAFWASSGQNPEIGTDVLGIG